MRIIAIITATLLTATFFARSAHAESFQVWQQGFKVKAVAAGVSPEWFEKAMQGVEPIERVIELDGKQPEHKITFEQYKKNVISQTRIDKGRKLYKQHYNELKDLEKIYGVAPQYVIALWGIETNFGGYTGGFQVIDSLATLAWDGRRRAFFEKELINALKISQDGHISLKNMKGSWAGAMGQNQFMPSSFLAYAVDSNNDGKRDIWTDTSDVFASTSNYLKTNGWTAGEKWGRQVYLTKPIAKSLTGPKIKKSLSFWKELGVQTLTGKPLPTVDGMMASLVQPDGPEGPSYLAYNNYQSIMHWNRSTYFATSVGLLADLIAKQ